MSKTADPDELRRRRQARRSQKREGPDSADGSTPMEFAQGRPQPMLRVEDLPDAVDAPEAHGPLSSDEQEAWETCKGAFQQYHQAWWVAAKALDIALRGRLWRAEFDTAEAFIGVVADMSTSNAYRQIAGAEVAALLAAPPKIELESNDLSRMRDSAEREPAAEPLVISQRAAEALSPVRSDYGASVAADAYRTVAEVTGKDRVSQKVIIGIVQQLPRKEEEELSKDELTERIRSLAAAQTGKDATPKTSAVDSIGAFLKYVDVVKTFAERTGGMAAAYEEAAAVDKDRADEIASAIGRHMAHAAKNFPDV
ncbi:hypothetical protein ACIPSE_45030 [Streptomyces sp. NPDC090106]|uniref:hypothetical protein n=1 Tax=Streptomyces sp. NPDC090106 TaxID=3365946 RepID=UPI003818FB52